MRNTSNNSWASLLILLAAACSGVESADKLNDQKPASGGTAGVAGSVASGASGGAAAGTTSVGGASGSGTGGSAGSTAGVGNAAGTGGVNAAGGSAGTAAAGSTATGGSSGDGAGATAGTAGVGGDTSTGGVGGSAGDTATGGMAGTAGDTGTGGMAGTGGTGVDPDDPFAPRTGPFKMLVYSRTEGFEHSSIPAGQQMLRNIAQDYGFEVTVTTENNEITLEGLSQYEIVFFMNCTGDIFDAPHEAAFEEWMTTKKGAFAGAHSATDTERDWAFYKEVTGQYYDLHDNVSPGTIQWEADATNFVAVQGLPAPWQRNEEWYRFNSWQQWSSKEGFQILSKVTTNGGGTRPVSYIRQYSQFRSFYSSIGHEPQAFQDADVEKHFAAGIMWAVRREAMVQ